MGLRYDTLVATTTGWRPISEVGTRVTPITATSMVLVPKHINKGVCSTAGQRIVFGEIQPWLKAASEVVTYTPKPGDVFERATADFGFDSRNWLSGVLYGLRHPGGIVKVPKRLGHLRQKVNSFASAWEEKVTTLPQGDAQAIGSFVAGWAATIFKEGLDGNVRRIRMKDKEPIEWFMEYAPFGGYMATGGLCADTMGGFSVAFRHVNMMAGWWVSEMDEVPIEEDGFYKLNHAAVLKGGIRAIFR